MESWHTELERRLIEHLGGDWQRGYGADGTLNGAPVEVRAARESDKFRIGKDVHEELVAEDGHYIFHDDEMGTAVVDADRVADLMGSGDWLKDRDYPHKFVTNDEIF